MSLKILVSPPKNTNPPGYMLTNGQSETTYAEECLEGKTIKRSASFNELSEMLNVLFQS